MRRLFGLKAGFEPLELVPKLDFVVSELEKGKLKIYKAAVQTVREEEELK